MTISYLLAPIPKWVLIGIDGKTAGGAQLHVQSSLNPSQGKAVYQDPAGTLPYPNPVIFDANGTQGPFYWKVDSADLLDNYFLQAFDANGNELWTITNFFPPGSGGGGSSTTDVEVNNLIANNVFIDSMASMGSAANLTNTVICPSNHHGFTPDLVPVITSGMTGSAVGPDIRFVKNNTSLASDQITFVNFGAGSTPFSSDGDTTPVQYLRYQCSGSPSGETIKAFQFPITQGVKNLENTQCTFRIWAKTAVNPFAMTVVTRQYFGSGTAASAEALSTVGTINLTTSWTPYLITFTVPGIGGSTPGQCGDDALYIQLGMQLNTNCDIQFVKPALYVGALAPAIDFDSYDQIDSITQLPRTGEHKTSLRNTLAGWIPAIDGSIALTSGGTIRNNVDTFSLYKTLWDSVSQTYAPVAGGTRGADAVTDFSANKAITITRALGRAVTGNNANFITAVNFTADIPTNTLTWASSINLPTSTPVILSTTGALPTGLLINVVYYVISLGTGNTFRLALSPDNAINAITITISGTQSGTHTCSPTLGVIYGEGVHTLTVDEMPSHNHPSTGADFIITGSTDTGATGATTRTHTPTTGNRGGGLPHNNTPASTLYNVFFKL